LYDIYLPGGGGQALVYTEVTGMICGLRMHPLADAEPYNF